MKINWDSIKYQEFVSKALPQIVCIYFGDSLKPKSSEGTIDFFYDDIATLRVYPRRESIGPEQFKTLAGKLLNDVSAGLIVSWEDSPFRIQFFPKSTECWIPVALWGWRQIDAIARLNRQPLEDLLPFVDFTPKPGSYHLGTGTALWTDIAKFIAIGVQIGQRLAMNPVDAMKRIIRDVDHYFQHWKERWSFETKVGADGWYHFFGSGSSANALELGISIQNEFRSNLTNDFYTNTDVHLAMGANEIASCEMDRGGPYDLDSLTTYGLITERRFWKYDLRATEQIVRSKVGPSDISVWESMGDFSLPFHNSPISVRGHSDYPLSRH
jgi:hypothetical protein